MTSTHQHHPLPLGGLLCAAGLIHPAELDAALQVQQATGERLGETLVRRTSVNAKDTAAALMVQRKVRDALGRRRKSRDHVLPEGLRLGEILVARGDLAPNALEKALSHQPEGVLLGELLLQVGAVSKAALESAIPLQKRLLSAVLCAGLGFALAMGTPPAHAAGVDSARITISATIAKRVTFALKSQPSVVTITQQDVQRGYVDVAQPSVFDVKTNSAQGVALEFQSAPIATDVLGIEVMGAGPLFRMSASGGILLLTDGWHPTLLRSLMLTYRLHLGPSAKPGTYSWPVAMTITAL